MCGISGIISADPTIVTRERLDRMSDTLRHRGPDDAGRWIGRDGDLTVGLSHRRLSIIDLSTAGHQPMPNEDEGVWLTYNGEIYNHAAIRQELERAGHTYRSHTDSETIIHAYEEFGDDCVTRFRGMFAFALWDARRRRLLLVRDRLGIKPLYFATVGRTLIFASEIKAILASGLVPARIAPGAVPEYLTFGYLAGDGTMFDGIRKLPPGCRLVWDESGWRIERYWQLRFQPNEAASAEELQHRFREIFDEAVRLRLMSDVPLGVFLSGGLDSSAIAAVMGRHVTDPIKTFSVGYSGRYYSELPYARQVAQQIRSDHHEVLLGPDDFYHAVPRLVWHEDEPLWGTASVALYFVSRLAADHVTVVLTGEGSDELFAGYDRYWMTALNARALGAYRWLPGPARSALRGLLVNGPLPERVRRSLGHTFVNHDSLPDGLFFENWFGVIPPAWQARVAAPALRRELAATDVYASHRAIFDESEARDLVDRLLYTDIHASLVELLMKQDQMSMATSIESRVPFLDHHLVEFAATVPSRHKIKGTSGKHLVKDALAGLLPDSIRHRAKKGFPVPWEEWLDERYAAPIEKLLTEPRSLDRGWLERTAIAGLFSDHRRKRANHSRQIWTLWGLELWARTFLDGEMPAELDAPTATSGAAAPQLIHA